MPAFTVSDAARPRIEALRKQSGKPEAYLRVSIDGVK
jgi:Fe-S cluster assembly iron-binding protein IscA